MNNEDIKHLRLCLVAGYMAGMAYRPELQGDAAMLREAHLLLLEYAGSRKQGLNRASPGPWLVSESKIAPQPEPQPETGLPSANPHNGQTEAGSQ